MQTLLREADQWLPGDRKEWGENYKRALETLGIYSLFDYDDGFIGVYIKQILLC